MESWNPGLLTPNPVRFPLSTQLLPFLSFFHFHLIFASLAYPEITSFLTPNPTLQFLYYFASWQMLEMCFKSKSHFGFPFLVGLHIIISPELQLNFFLGDLIMTINLQGTVITSLLQILTHSISPHIPAKDPD